MKADERTLRRGHSARAAALVVSAALAGCTPMPQVRAPPPPPARAGPVMPLSRPAPAAAAAPVVDQALPAPKAGAVALSLAAADAGGSFTIRPGDRMSVSLVGIPTAGILWAAPTPPAFLKLIGETSGPTHAAQLQPGFAGGEHWEVTVFEATGRGKAKLAFEQRRPWEKGGPPAAEWSATIEVK